MEAFNNWMVSLNDVLWHNVVLYIVLATGVLFTAWSRFGQGVALTHGWKVIRGQYDDPADPGAINHFQALSAALSATVGLGNIGGVALAIALGGPGAVFWMWVVGTIGMALKMTEVTLAMLYRNTDDPDNPHGGPMFVAKKAFAQLGLPRLGVWWGGVFCVCLLIATGIGVSRVVAAAIEQNHDNNGIIWPDTIAPFHIALVHIGYRKSDKVRETVDKLYSELVHAGYDVLLDDRDERPGVIFADMDLIGIPHRIVIGDKGLAKGVAEFKGRRDAAPRESALDDVANEIRRLVHC